MSEYQYYEFVAIDRPLGDEEQAQMRGLSSRADITATSFVNEYDYGDFRGSPGQLMGLWYDAHLHVTSWGTHRLMVRIPIALADFDAYESYIVDGEVDIWSTDEHVIIDLTSNDEGDDYDLDAPAMLSSMVGIRGELAAGDLRALYLGWLAAQSRPFRWVRENGVLIDDEDESTPTPPVPPGLRALTSPQRALARYLRVDDDLLRAAAESSADIEDTTDEYESFVRGLAATEKDALLVRVLRDGQRQVHLELMGRYRESLPRVDAPAGPLVAELLRRADQLATTRERSAARKRAREKARIERERLAAHERRLAELSEDRVRSWSRVEAHMQATKAADYDCAVALLTDLQEVYHRGGDDDEFVERVAVLRNKNSRKVSLMKRLTDAGL